MNEAVSRAFEHSYAIEAARTDSAAAAMAYAGARSERFPVLTLEARTSYVDDLQLLDLPFGSREIGSKDNYQADLTLSVPLFTGGRLKHRIGAEFENSRMHAADVEAKHMAVAYQCRQAYLHLIATRSLTEAASASLNRLMIINRDVQNLFENGVADSIDLLETELALEKGKQLLDQRRRDEANASAVLSRLIDLEENETINLMDTIMPPSQSKYQESLSRSVIKRPELEKFDYLIGAAEHAMGAEKGAYVPTLSGFAGYSYGMPNRDWFNKTWNDYFTVGLTLHWQLNLGGKTARNLDAARMRAASIRANRGNLQESLLTGRDMAANNLRFSYDAYRISSNEFNIATRRFHLARLRQEAGQISVNRLLEMEADLTATEQQLRAATVQYYLAENEYLYAIGSDQLYGGLK